jgi:hypothetical protein
MKVSDFGGIGSPVAGLQCSARSSGLSPQTSLSLTRTNQRRTPLRSGNRNAGFLVDPPFDELGDPAVGVGIAGGADVGADPAHRAVPADHVPELLGGEVRQLVEADERDLRPLPIEDGLVVLEVAEADRGAARKAPFEHMLARPGAAEG